MRLLYSRVTGKTGRKLAGVMDVPASNSFKEDDVIINWGKSLGIPSNNAIWINKPEAVALASNKPRALREVIETYNNATLLIDNENIMDYIFNRYRKLLARPNKHHAGGEFIEIHDYSTALDYLENPDYHLMKFIDIKEEYRIQVIGRKVVRIQKKVPKTDDYNPLVRNHANGWRFVSNKEFPMGLLNAMTNSVLIIDNMGLDFGALDVASDGENYYYLEVNTAPGLDDHGLEIYSKKLKELANEKISF